MRLVSWNCQGALRRKLRPLLELHPNLLLVQECEELGKVDFPESCRPSYSWRTASKSPKGLAVFGFGGISVSNLGEDSGLFRPIVPFSVSTGSLHFTLFAVWASAGEGGKTGTSGRCGKP